MPAVRIRWFDQTDRPSDQDSEYQCDRQDASIVPVKLDFRQNIDEGNAEKDAGAQPECPSQDQGLRVPEALDAEVARDGTDRTQQRVTEVDRDSTEASEPRRRHQRRDRQRVEWLVQGDRQKCAEPDETQRRIVSVPGNAGSQSHAIHDRVHAETDAHADPAEAARQRRLGALISRRVIVSRVVVMLAPAVVVMIVSRRRVWRELVLVKMKPANHQHRAEQTDHRRDGRDIE